MRQWNHDPDWQQHKEKYSAYDFDQFTKDWGPMSDYGKIRSHQILMAKSYGNGVVIGVNINGGKTPLFLRVDSKDQRDRVLAGRALRRAVREVILQLSVFSING